MNVYDAKRKGKGVEERICNYALTIMAAIVVLLVVVVVAFGIGLALFAPPLHGVFVMSFSAVTHEISALPLPQLGIPSMKFILIDESSPAEHASRRVSCS